jgi:hypothetical protein
VSNTGNPSPLEVEEPAQQFKSTPDNRVRMPEPLPVRMVAVEDVRLPAPAGVETQLDEFYVKLLEFERVAGELSYRADNFTLRFDVLEHPLSHDSLRPTQIEVLSLADAQQKLIDREIEYTRQRGVTPGQETLVLLDPAGNWVELIEYRQIR